MAKGPGDGRKRRSIVLFLLLAALCIGGAELAACRRFEPELYARITTPVYQAAEAVWGLCRSGAERAADAVGAAAAACRNTAQRLAGQVSGLWAELTAPRQSPEDGADTESQLASEPVADGGVVVSDPSVTELVDRDGREILNGGFLDIVYFCQGDEVWAEEPYGSDKIGGYGCGPTAMAMAVASMTGEETDPAAMAQWAVDHGYWARRSGSRHSIVLGTAQAFGLEGESFPSRDPEELVSALLEGKLLVALMGPGHFTQRGHFILLRGVTLTGKVLVADPNSRERSLAVWDPQLILDELSPSTNSGAPLWALWAPRE